MTKPPPYLPTRLTEPDMIAVLACGPMAQVVDRVLVLLGASSRAGWRGSDRQLVARVRSLSGVHYRRDTVRHAMRRLVKVGRLTIERHYHWSVYTLATGLAGQAGWPPDVPQIGPPRGTNQEPVGPPMYPNSVPRCTPNRSPDVPRIGPPRDPLL